ncbi:TetR/AcrR family transcriptional regulator [Sphingomonas japonica]|uniref:AcrR family transcriptional regulator n=1 Tax=Sphingomonas japonica TaxID=511662 RepID=A0ABX0TWJ9_9SPHN|nr:TetR/AcrR family transcriptional regulator [Sphingomonas japonica]NIJ22694.1 AcrR family transcriptional regulator [Sphingomonas japonica]
MARTQAADFEQRQAAIVDRAARLFAGSGFRGTSIADIAAACETSKSLIYHYYPSKEDVLYAVMASHVDQLVDDVAAVRASTEGATGRLRLLLQKFMAHYVGAADRQKVLLNELANLPPERRRTIVAKQRGIVEAVRALLIEIDPMLAADRATAQTMLLFGAINWTHTWFDPAGALSADAIADMALEMVAKPG